MLVLARYLNDPGGKSDLNIQVGDIRFIVRLLEVRGKDNAYVRLGVEAPPDVIVERAEISERT